MIAADRAKLNIANTCLTDKIRATGGASIMNEIGIGMNEIEA